MERGKLNKDVTLVPFEFPTCGKITLPAGTETICIERGIGLPGSWAVASVALLTELTGNAHDSKHRYCWIDPADVTPD
jgi:hypothetical protein